MTILCFVYFGLLGYECLVIVDNLPYLILGFSVFWYGLASAKLFGYVVYFGCLVY